MQVADWNTQANTQALVAGCRLEYTGSHKSVVTQVSQRITKDTLRKSLGNTGCPATSVWMHFSSV